MSESQEGNILNNEEQTQYQELLEIASPHKNSLINSTPQRTQRKSERNANFMKCCEHNPKEKCGDTWTTTNANCDSCVMFSSTINIVTLVLHQ